MASLIEHKCPNCGGTLKFSAKDQKVVCEHCNSEFEVNSLIQSDDMLDGVEGDLMSEKHETISDGENLNVYRCSSCGSQIICDDNTASTLCPYCDSAVILTGRLAGELKPDKVIPFKEDKYAVRTHLDKYLKKRWLLPGVFKVMKHVDDIQSLYVPYWLYDCDLYAKIRFKGTQTRYWSDGNYEYHETKYYTILRDGTIGFDHLPVDGSKRLADDMLESLEPFDYSGADKFQTAYLSGYKAEKYDVDEEECSKRAMERFKEGTIDAFRNTVHGMETVTVTSSYFEVKNKNVEYALFPVWLFNVHWNNKIYRYGINGQTGKTVGEMPLSPWKLTLLTLIWALVAFGAVFGIAIGVTLGMDIDGAAGISAVAGGIAAAVAIVLTLLICFRRYKPIRKQHGAANYYRKDSLNITNSLTIYTGHHVTRTKIYKPSNNK